MNRFDRFVKRRCAVGPDFTGGENTIASFLYLSDGWSPARGGRLRLFAANDASAPSVAVDPIRNRFIAFQTRPEHWRAVERVHGRERLSVLALWNIEAGEAGAE
jgi:Rps23 Pro-64 3,4-dihydroxylase Tpa1-like proline 4-hydroxylase